MVKDVIKDHSKAFPLLFKETKEKLREVSLQVFFN